MSGSELAGPGVPIQYYTHGSTPSLQQAACNAQRRTYNTKPFQQQTKGMRIARLPTDQRVGTESLAREYFS